MKLNNREAYENQYLRLSMEAKQEINTEVFSMEDIDLIGELNKLLIKLDCIPYEVSDFN